MTPAERLSSYLSALRPIIYIHHFDFAAVDSLLSDAIQSTLIEEYNNASGKVNFRTKISPCNDFDYLQNLSSAGKLSSFLSESITDLPLEKVLVLRDVHEELRDSSVIAHLKSIAQRTMHADDYWVPIIIISSKLVIPTELEKLITVFDIPLPERKEIEQMLSEYANFYEFKISDTDLSDLSLAFKGLSEFEITQILNLAYQRSGKVSAADKELILREKEQSIKKSGLLEAVRVNHDVDDIGGLDNLVAYLRKKSYIYQNLSKAIKAGVDIPKGILIVGMPGCGKSLTAKAAANLFKVPLLRLDVGKLLGKYVGESEENLRSAIKMAEATTPCVLWIDEIEKAFAGVGKDESGGGVTTRLFGHFLTWMQEKESTVYVVATANDITNIPPEFLRKGRFDEMFSVNLPNDEERKKIFEIHLARRKPHWKKTDINLNKLVKETGSSKVSKFSGADIEAIVKTAVEMAFENNREICQDDLEKAIKQTTPIADTLSEKIKLLQECLKKYQIQDASKLPDTASTDIRQISDNLQSVAKNIGLVCGIR